MKERLILVPKEKHDQYKERLEKEIEVITNMKFPGYMLIVWDFIRYAKEMGIPVEHGRECGRELGGFCFKNHGY